MTLVSLIKLLQELARRHRKKVFALREISWLARETQPSIGMTLLRAQHQGVVGHVGNMWLNLIDPPTREEAALALRSPSYISFESACYHHGILSQAPRGVCTMATTGRPGTLATPVGAIEYVHLGPHLFFGFDAARMALPEKAVLDLTYIQIRRGVAARSEVFYLDRLNRRRIARMLPRYPAHLRRTIAAMTR